MCGIIIRGCKSDKVSPECNSLFVCLCFLSIGVGFVSPVMFDVLVYPRLRRTVVVDG